MLEYFFVISISIYSYKRVGEWIKKRKPEIHIKKRKIEDMNEDDIDRLLELEDKLKQKIKTELDKDSIEDSSQYLEKLKEVNQKKSDLLKEQDSLISSLISPEMLSKGKKVLKSFITYIKKKKS